MLKQIAAESLGLGVVPIGGIRNQSRSSHRIIRITKFTFPMVGLVVGYPADESHKKPRISFESYKHNEVYNVKAVEESIDIYDAKMSEYLKEIGRYEQEINWSSRTSSIYQYVYFPKVKDAVIKQGLNKIRLKQ